MLRHFYLAWKKFMIKPVRSHGKHQQFFGTVLSSKIIYNIWYKYKLFNEVKFHIVFIFNKISLINLLLFFVAKTI